MLRHVMLSALCCGVLWYPRMGEQGLEVASCSSVLSYIILQIGVAACCSALCYPDAIALRCIILLHHISSHHSMMRYYVTSSFTSRHIIIPSRRRPAAARAIVVIRCDLVDNAHHITRHDRMPYATLRATFSPPASTPRPLMHGPSYTTLNKNALYIQ